MSEEFPKPGRVKIRGPKYCPEYDREFCRGREHYIGFIALHTCPTRPGVQSSLIENQEDYFTYVEAVHMATGYNKKRNFIIKTDTLEDAVECCDLHVLDIFREAVRDVKEAREKGITYKAKRVVSLISAKLALEAELGELPTQKEVKALAFNVYVQRFGEAGLAKDGHEEWKTAFVEAGLDYLPTRARKQKRNSR